METFAEAWVAANTQTAVNLQLNPRGNDPRPLRASQVEEQELPTMLSKEHLEEERQKEIQSSRPSTALSQCYSPSVLKPLQQSQMSAQDRVDARMVAIHCLIEPSSTYEPEVPIIQRDTYIVLPGATPFREIVETALLKQGHTHSDAMGAKGYIQVREWQPLPFHAITNDPDATVEQILGDMTNIAVLKIKLCGYCPDHDNIDWNDQTVRCAVNELMKEMNQSKLAKISPLSQSTISNITNSKYNGRIGTDKCREFGGWYRMFRQNQNSDQEDAYCQMYSKDTRLTFHPIFELPKMRDWYCACKNPSDQILRRFLEELNEGHIRQQRHKISLSKLKIWWKNEKQREKRLQMRLEKEITQGSAVIDSPQRQQHNPSMSDFGNSPDHIHVTDLTNMQRDPMLGHQHEHDISNSGHLHVSN